MLARRQPQFTLSLDCLAATVAAMDNEFDTAFSIASSHITFGPGCLREAGDIAQELGISRIALFTDPVLADLNHVQVVIDSLKAAGLSVAVYPDVAVEPTDKSFTAASEFATSAQVDGFISVGGGSVIDTAKAANLYSTYPADLLTYVNAPIGAGDDPPGPLKPHIACPTTSGTGSECTGIAVFDLLEMKAKTGIASKAITPTRALIDPKCTETLPAEVVACSAFDVLSHALESYTARRFTQREAPPRPSLRPSGQGSNPWSDLGCTAALEILGRHLVSGVEGNVASRHELMWAASLAGIAFGNAGCHAPHGMSYSVSGLVKDYRPAGYPDISMVPHGMSVVLNAPAVFRKTAPSNPSRHLEASRLLGADISLADPADAGEVLADQLVSMMRATDMPNGLSGVGYTDDDIPDLVSGALPQRRLLDNAPIPMDEAALTEMYADAMRYW